MPRTRSTTPKLVEKDIDEVQYSQSRRSRRRSSSSSEKSSRRAAAAARREFGDQMAKEGETSHISTIILIMYGVLTLYSVAVGYFTEQPWWGQLAFYFAGMIAFYAWHWMAHTRLFKTMYRIHMQHHLKRFPPNNFYGKPGVVKQEYGFDTPTLWQLIDPRKSTYFTLAHEGPLYLFMGIILAFGYVVLRVPVPNLVATVVLYGVMGSVGSALHASFHVRNFELEKYQWYMELRALHYVHHLGNMKSNFAVLNLGMDGLFRSLVLVDPVKKRRTHVDHVADKVDDNKLPAGVSRRHLHLVRSSSGIASYLLGLDHAHLTERETHHAAVTRGYPTVLLRLVLVAAGVWLWRSITSAIAGADGASALYNVASPVTIKDFVHEAAQPITDFITAGPARWIIVAATSAYISDIGTLLVLVWSVAGRSMRPFLSLAAALLLREAVCILGAIPGPGAIWPSSYIDRQPFLFFVPATTNDFLCPRVLLGTVFAGELLQLAFTYRKGSFARLTTVATAAFVFFLQVIVSIALRTHWTFDVLLAIVLARATGVFGKLAAPIVDAFMP